MIKETIIKQQYFNPIKENICSFIKETIDGIIFYLFLGLGTYLVYIYLEKYGVYNTSFSKNLQDYFLLFLFVFFVIGVFVYSYNNNHDSLYLKLSKKIVLSITSILTILYICSLLPYLGNEVNKFIGNILIKPLLSLYISGFLVTISNIFIILYSILKSCSKK